MGVRRVPFLVEPLVLLLLGEVQAEHLVGQLERLADIVLLDDLCLYVDRLVDRGGVVIAEL